MVLPALYAAGMEVMVARMARKLARRGHEVGITCVEEKGPLAPGLEQAGIRVSDVGAQGFAHPRWLMRLARHFRHIAPDVVHVHSGAWFKGIVAARLARVPLALYTAHGFISRERPAETISNLVAVRLTHRVVAVSGHLAVHLAQRRLAGARISVVSNGIDVDQFHPGAATGVLRRRLGLTTSAVIVGTVARLEPIKNQAMLIEGLARARADGLDCAAVLIGDGGLRGDLEALATGLGISDSVHFWGLESDVAPLYPELDIFTLTSDLEGTSISLLEAMASGVCAIATRVGGNPAVVGDGGAALLVEPRRPDQLAAALRELVPDAARRRRIGAAARARVVAHFSDESMLDAYERIYREAARPDRQRMRELA